jgi:hypothetical protein
MRSVPRPCCRDADVVLVMPVAEDERYEWARETVETSGAGDAVLVLDEHARVPWAEGLGHVVRAQGSGLGRALDAGFRYALQLGAEWIVKSDAHVRYREPVAAVLSEGWAAELGRRYALQPGIAPVGWGAVEYGAYLDYETWEWRWNWEPWRALPCATEPVLIFHRSLVEEVLRWQPWVFAVPYWGKESFDLTLTLARIGHPVLAVPRPVVEHRYKESWPEERLRRWEESCAEPWRAELEPGENPYFASIRIGDAIFALRHYRSPERRAFWRGVGERWASVAKRYFPDRARYAGLRYTTEQVYAALASWGSPPSWSALLAVFAASLGLGYLAGRLAGGRRG